MNVVDHYREINIPIDNIFLKGNLRLADNSKGLIIFSHGSGSSRLSSRNNYVAELLFKKNFSSLLFDLLTEEEDLVYENRFDIELLTIRLLKVTDWIVNNDKLNKLPLAYFGASTGAASALCAASKLDNNIKAVVSRGGRPDLANECLHDVNVPTLLLVGGDDVIVIELNTKAQHKINAICELRIIEGATHLFSEPGKLDIVSNETIKWFNRYVK